MPSASPSDAPSKTSSGSPSGVPSGSPSNKPSVTGSEEPSASPSDAPSKTSSESPSDRPSGSPSNKPSTTGSDVPSSSLSKQPTVVLATMSGTVFEDTDNDGDGNVKLSGVLIMLQDIAGTVLATTLTDSEGTYKFFDLQTGTHYVLQDNLGSYDVKDKDGGNPNNITVSVIGGDDSMGNDFVDSLQDFCEAVITPSCTLCVPYRSPGMST